MNPETFLLLLLRLCFYGQQDDSVAKGACSQPDAPSSIPGIHMVRET